METNLPLAKPEIKTIVVNERLSNKLWNKKEIKALISLYEWLKNLLYFLSNYKYFSSHPQVKEYTLTIILNDLYYAFENLNDYYEYEKFKKLILDIVWFINESENKKLEKLLSEIKSVIQSLQKNYLPSAIKENIKEFSEELQEILSNYYLH